MENHMIEVRIYCIKSHIAYQSAYDAINQALKENKLEYVIYRIEESDFIKRRHIKNMPHIVINNQIAISGKCPTKNDVRMILIRMKLL